MTNTSPRYGFPAPDGTDLVIAGDDAVEALRDALEAALTPRYFLSTEGATGAIPIGTWSALVFANAIMSDFTLSGDGVTLTYTGTAERWFHLTAGSVLYSAGDSVKGLRLVINGVPQPSQDAFGSRVSLAVAVPTKLDPGFTVSVEATGGAASATASAGYVSLLGGL